MADETNQGLSPNFSKQVDIESLISAPLVAASKANVVMVTGQTRFLLEYCFTKDDNGTRKPVMIDMVMSRSYIEEQDMNDGNPPVKVIKKADLNFSVPLLCLVPINSLAINKVSLGFELEITSVSAYETQHRNDSGQKITDKKVVLNGKISYDHDQNGDPSKSQYKSSMSSKLNVNVEAGPLPLPAGVLALIDLYTKSIQPI